MNIINQIKQRYNLANIVERIIYINVAVFIITFLLKAIAFLMQWDENPLFQLFALPSEFNTYLYKFWTIFTYGFLHAGIWHILFNMLLLYYLGNLFLDFFSKKQLLTYFLGGIIAGGIIFLVSYNLLPALKGKSTFLVGASAGVTAVVIGLATKIPNYAIRFRFIGAIKLWYIALILVLVDFIQISVNTGGHLAHLGGAVFGFLLTKYFNDGKELTNTFSTIFKKKKQKPLKTVYKKRNPSKTVNKAKNQEKIDAILDKISKHGYEKLTKEEKDFLFSASKDT